MLGREGLRLEMGEIGELPHVEENDETEDVVRGVEQEIERRDRKPTPDG